MENYYRQIILVLSLLLFFILESLFPHFKNRSFSLQTIHSIKNILLGIINSLLMLFLFSYVIGLVMEFSRTNHLGILHLLPIPLPVMYIAGYVLFDLWMYLWHRFNHKFRLLWKFHQVHHTDIYMNASSAIRFHPVEILISTIIRLPVLFLIGMTPEILVVYEVCLNVSTLFHHSNWALPESVDSLLRLVIVTPNMHRVHHSVKFTESDSNYSTTFSFWDRIFNSFIQPENPRDIILGVKGHMEKKWQRFDYLLTTPFIPKKK